MKRKSWIVGGLIVVVLLAGAAFVGGRLLNQTEVNGGLVPGNPAEGGKSSVRLKVIRAGELPAAGPYAIGEFADRRDISLFVASDSKFQILTNKDGSVRTDGLDTGQRLEVVVTTETTLYEDVTGAHFVKGSPPPADGKIQQEVKAGSLDRIGTNSVVWAWGERHGDRLIARARRHAQPTITRRAGRD